MEILNFDKFNMSKTSMHDPDMGNWSYYYDANGNMTSQLDSMNQQSFNRYAYVRNNPINLIDPSGHSWLSKHTGIEWKMSKDQQAGLIIIATAAATWYCGGCGAAGLLQGALVGEIGGGIGAYATGGDVLQGVVIGGITGGTIGYFTGPIYTPGTVSNTYAANEASFNLYNGAISSGTASDAGPIAMGSTASQFCSGGWCFGIGAAGAGGAAIGSGGGGGNGGGSRGDGGGTPAASIQSAPSFPKSMIDNLYTDVQRFVNPDAFGENARLDVTMRALSVTVETMAFGGAHAEVQANAFSQGNVFKIISNRYKVGFRVDPAHHGKSWGHPHFWRW